MKIKKLFIVALMAFLSFSLMACPEVVNKPPQIVQIQNGEVVEITEVVYEHVKGTTFDPEAMLQSLIDNQGLAGIDYIQTGLALSKDRKYNDISENIVIETFYDIWLDGEDANYDGVVDEADEVYIGQYKTDQEGNYIFDQNKLLLISVVFNVGKEVDFTLKLTDDSGEVVLMPGKIVIISGS